VALWQFITFTVLIGALLVYASVITRRLGCADARLNRIEEVLLTKSSSFASADTQAAESKSEVSGGQEGRGRALTIGDLRQLSSRTTRPSSWSSVAVSERRDAPNTPRGLMRSRGATTEREGSVAIGSESGEAPRARREQLSFHGTRPLTLNCAPTSSASRDTPATSSEPPSLLTVEAVSGDSAATTSASRDAQATNSGSQSPPSYRLPSDDSVDKKNRDMMLFLSSQRRRRRARLAY
jgi:hypothetical protein